MIHDIRKSFSFKSFFFLLHSYQFFLYYDYNLTQCQSALIFQPNCRISFQQILQYLPYGLQRIQMLTCCSTLILLLLYYNARNSNLYQNADLKQLVRLAKANFVNISMAKIIEIYQATIIITSILLRGQVYRYVYGRKIKFLFLLNVLVNKSLRFQDDSPSKHLIKDFMNNQSQFINSLCDCSNVFEAIIMCYSQFIYYSWIVSKLMILLLILIFQTNEQSYLLISQYTYLKVFKREEFNNSIQICFNKIQSITYYINIIADSECKGAAAILICIYLKIDSLNKNNSLSVLDYLNVVQIQYQLESEIKLQIKLRKDPKTHSGLMANSDEFYQNKYEKSKSGKSQLQLDTYYSKREQKQLEIRRNKLQSINQHQFNSQLKLSPVNQHSQQIFIVLSRKQEKTLQDLLLIWRKNIWNTDGTQKQSFLILYFHIFMKYKLDENIQLKNLNAKANQFECFLIIYAFKLNYM
ncbi:hypothetical protein pb186bvf_001886 [Paramecium bursaria]